MNIRGIMALDDNPLLSLGKPARYPVIDITLNSIMI